MAEVFGLIASGVSIGALAGQIASSVVKLKSYLDQVRDAPEDITILIDEINDLHFLLSDIEDDQRRNPYSAILLDNKSASRCLDHCKRGVERLRRVVDEMTVEFECLKPMNRRWKAAKMIWKRDKADKYRAELASAVRLLTLSHQIYTRSIMQLQPDIITSRITRIMQIESAKRTSIHSPLSSSTVQVQGSCSSMRTDCTIESYRSRRKQSSWLRWKSYSLLVGRAWDMELRRSQQGWDFSMSVYACVSDDSLVAHYIWDGNVEGLQRLFSRREASPFTVCLRTDLDPVMGRTLLELAAEDGNFKLCEFLINEGADPEYFEDHISSMAPIDWFAINGVMYDSFNNNSCQLARLLGARSEITFRTLTIYRGPVSVFSILLKQMDPPIGELPLVHRCNLAIELASNAHANGPDLFRMALDCNPMSCAVIADQGIGKVRRTLLHAAAGAVGQVTLNSMKWVSTEESERCPASGWKSIIQDLVAAGADLHATISRRDLGFHLVEGYKTNRQITPLMFMFASVYFHWPRSYHSEILDRAMGFWVSALHDSGVDLKEYGQRESLIWASLGESGEDKAEYIEYTTGGTSDYYFGDRRLLGFCYGPFPEDWRVWENEPTDEFAGDFWLMLDKIVEVMPGTWIE